MIFGRLRSVQRRRQMRGLDVFTPCQVCDGPCQFHASRAVTGACRQV